jgi:hypothetical protein
MTTPSDTCERHEREIDRLRELVHGQEGELSRREAVVVGLQRDMHALSARVPVDLGQWMGTVTTKLDAMSRGQNDVVSALREGYVTVSELEVIKQANVHFATKSELELLKAEIAPIRAAFWKAAAFIGIALLAGLLTLLFEVKKLAPAIPPVFK